MPASGAAHGRRFTRRDMRSKPLATGRAIRATTRSSLTPSNTRLVHLRAEEQGRAIVMTLARYGQELSQGAIVTVEAGRVRVRPPENNAG